MHEWSKRMLPQEMAPECPGRRSDHRPLCRRCCGRVPTQAGCGAVPPRRAGKAGPVWAQPPPGQDPPRGVRAVRRHEPTTARGGQAGNIRLPGLHALLHDDPARTLSAWSQNGSTGPWRASTRDSASGWHRRRRRTTRSRGPQPRRRYALGRSPGWETRSRRRATTTHPSSWQSLPHLRRRHSRHGRTPSSDPQRLPPARAT